MIHVVYSKGEIQKMSKNDSKIKALLEKIEEQKKELGTKPRASWNTNGLFKRYESLKNDLFNINTVNNAYDLTAALGFLISMQDAFDKAAIKLNVEGKVGPFRWDGYTVKQWEEDFALRIAIIEYDRKKKTLDETKSKLKSLVSEEERTAMELEEIEALLKD